MGKFNKFYFVFFMVGNSLISFLSESLVFCEKMSEWAMAQKTRDLLICSFLVSDLSDSLINFWLNKSKILFFSMFYIHFFKFKNEQFAGLGIRSFQKNLPIFAFFSVLYKRMFRSLRSFPLFIKERSDLCVLFRSL